MAVMLHMEEGLKKEKKEGTVRFEVKLSWETEKEKRKTRSR